MKLYFARKEQYAIAVLLVAIIGALLVLSYAYGNRNVVKTEEPPLSGSSVITNSHDTTPADQSSASTAITIHVTGAVQKPGLYTLPVGARINDAITYAGGASEDGYPDALNLAAKLSDGDKLYVPTKAEWTQLLKKEGCPPLVQSSSVNTSATNGTPSSDTVAATAQQTSMTTPPSQEKQPYKGNEPKALPAEPISINTATAAELMTLPRIGQVTAQHIIDYRTQHGKFTDLSQLLDIPRIGPKTLEKIKPYLTL